MESKKKSQLIKRDDVLNKMCSIMQYIYMACQNNIIIVIVIVMIMISTEYGEEQRGYCESCRTNVNLLTAYDSVHKKYPINSNKIRIAEHSAGTIGLPQFLSNTLTNPQYSILTVQAALFSHGGYSEIVQGTHCKQISTITGDNYCPVSLRPRWYVTQRRTGNHGGLPSSDTLGFSEK